MRYALYCSAILFVSGFVGGSAGCVAQEVASPLPSVKNGFVVIAHRGNHVDVPENTLASLEAAIASGADYAEIDLRTTRDGKLVLSHDATVDRMTDGKGNVKNLSLEDILKLRIKGHAAIRDTAVYQIPEFKDVLKVCKGRINIYLDFKEADPAEAYRQIQAAGMERQIVVYLNKEAQYKQWKDAAPAMPLMTSLPEGVKTAAELMAFLGKVGVAVLDNIQEPSMVEIARKRGIAVWLDVEGPGETPALWNETMRKGIQGMQTDHPEALTEYLIKSNLRDGLRVFQKRK